MTVEKQIEIPILRNNTLTLNTTIKYDAQQFITPFALVDLKDSILGTPLAEVAFQIDEKKIIRTFRTILEFSILKNKKSTLDRELLGIVDALQIYEFLFLGSPHRIHIFTDHKPHYIVFSVRKKAISVHDFTVLK